MCSGYSTSFDAPTFYTALFFLQLIKAKNTDNSASLDKSNIKTDTKGKVNLLDNRHDTGENIRQIKTFNGTTIFGEFVLII